MFTCVLGTGTNARVVRYAFINCSGFRNKAGLIEALLEKWDLDFLVLFETWVGPETIMSLSGQIVFAQVCDGRSFRRHSYGEAVMINPQRMRPEDVVMIYSSAKTHVLVFRVPGGGMV